MTDDDAKKIEADEADEAGVWVVGEISKERVITVPNVAAVEAEIERLRALVTSTRAEADAATQRSAEGELAARAEVERLTGDREELTVRLRAVEARLQTAERIAASSWDKAHVEAGFYEWLEDLRKGRHEGEWEPFKVAVERAEAGA